MNEMVQEIQRERPRLPAGLKPVKKRIIAICTPTLGHVSMWWTTALMDIAAPMNTGKAFIPMIDREGGNIGEIRNRLVQMCFAFEQADNVEIHSILWLDDDVIANRAVICALAAHDRDIASGVYFCKGEPGAAPLIFAGPGSGSIPFKPDAIFEAWGWAQGLSLVKMDVYRQLLKEKGEELGKDRLGQPAFYKVPDFGVDENGGLITGGTEDFHFFKHCNELGYRALVDCTRFAFGWHFSSPEGTGYPKKQWEQWMKREPITWDTKEGQVVWDK